MWQSASRVPVSLVSLNHANRKGLAVVCFCVGSFPLCVPPFPEPIHPSAFSGVCPLSLIVFLGNISF